MADILKVSEHNLSSGDFMRLQANPMFGALRETLMKDVEQTTNLPVTLIKVEDDSEQERSMSMDPAVVAVQEANLQSDFQQLIPCGNQKVAELQSFYNRQCATIENERNEAIQSLKENNMLSVSQYKRELHSIHTDHDEQRMHLTNRVTASLQLLKISLPSTDVSTSKSKTRQLNSRAVEIMSDWYDRHIHNPYPTDEEKQALAEMGGLTLGQVKAWFANKRNRTNNTKPKKQKMRVEKKLLSICSELSSGTANRPQFYGQIIEQLSDIVNCSQVFSRASGLMSDVSNVSSSEEFEIPSAYSD